MTDRKRRLEMLAEVVLAVVIFGGGLLGLAWVFATAYGPH